ncbi:MAG: malate synthase A, partial [Rhodospirillales bacterium]|nr:malate synthase A [Rhodospirillales bacterium]
MSIQLPEGVELRGAVKPGFETILTPEALAFIVDLQRRFNPTREALLAARAERQKRLDAGEKPDFLPETKQIRDSDWTVAPLPKDILDRRVEITGPVDRKMIVNALNCGANVFMADFEDASTPTWANMLEGQINLRDANRRQIDFVEAASGKAYKLNDKTAVLFVRPRGWHLPEMHLFVDGKPMSGSLFDFGLYFFHNARERLARGSGTYFYLPKMESHLEARLWNDVFVHAQNVVGVPQGTVKGTVLIETILATFEMDEILWELRQHSAGLNCGRWDYIFSFIKKFREQSWAVLPNRGEVTMTAHFLRSYSQLVIKTCHRREVHAMGGMAAQIPIKNDPAANDAAMERVRADKKREAGDGHDGTWVAHPGLVEIAKAEFDAVMKEPNQIARKRQDVHVTPADLIQMPEGGTSEAGLRQNVAVGIGYVEAWLRGIGCVPLFNLMEDAATAEISRAQVWQWVRHGQKLDDGRAITTELVRAIVREELDKVKARMGEAAY